MGITGLLPFIEKASRRTNVSEFSGCTVAIDSYCWLHKGAFSCADKLVRGESTDMHIRYCLKYVNMLLAKNVKPILVFDGRHLPAKAMTESKRRESRKISKKRAAELLSLGKMEEARAYMRRSVDITHEMALQLIQACRARNVDCIVAPYEADAQLAYLNVKNIAQLVITEDSDLILFGCTKVLFKMDLEGTGTLVETSKLPLVMKCPIEQYSFSKFRAMCVMSGCDYVASLPGIGLAKARQFVTATQDPDFANALRKLPSFFNRSNLVVTDEYRENFLKAEATFKHQYVYDPLQRSMVRLTDPQDEDIELALCVNAGDLLSPDVAFQLALGNLDPFTLKTMDTWDPDNRPTETSLKSTSKWSEKVAPHPSIWGRGFESYLNETTPWRAKPVANVSSFTRRTTRRVVHLTSKVVPETEDQDESLSIQTLSSMYCAEPPMKRIKTDEDLKPRHLLAQNENRNDKPPSPILENKERSFKKGLRNGNILSKLSRFPRTVMGDNIVESKFFSTKSTSEAQDENKEYMTKTDIEISTTSEINNKVIEESPVKSKNPFKKSTESDISNDTGFESNLTETLNISDSKTNVCIVIDDSPVKNNIKKSIDSNISNNSKGSSKNPFKKSIDSNTSNTSDSLRNTMNSDFKSDTSDRLRENIDSIDTDLTFCEDLDSSQKENSPMKSPILKPNSSLIRNAVRKLENSWSEDTIIENTYPMETLVTPVDSQESFGQSQKSTLSQSGLTSSQTQNKKKSTCRVPGLKRTVSLPSNQPTLLSKFGFQKKPVLKR